MNFIKRLAVIVVTITLGVSLLGVIPVLAAAPSITGVVIAPDPAYTDSTLEATPQGWSDTDGDPEGYQWQWRKYDTDSSTWEDISGATGNTLDSSNFTLNDQIKVICTPDDATDTGEPVEATVIISVLGYDVGIDVKPGSEENPINLKSRGVTPVAIYTTEGLDATAVDIETVKFGPGEAPVVHYAYEDIDDDGDIDLILHFRTQATGIAEDDTEVTLVGETDSGTAFTVTNAIKIVPSKANGAGQGNESAPGESTGGKATGKENAPGQNKEPGESATGKGQNKD